MNSFFMTLAVGISLSMDAFSLSIIYGMQGISKKNEIILSIVVGMFHFFMPLIGLLFGNLIYNYFIFNFNIVIAVIFGIIGLSMLLSIKEDKIVDVSLGIVGIFLFGLSVSIDSLITGIGFRGINNNYISVSSIFMICSGLFTFIGLRFGNKFSQRFGKLSTFCGGVMLVVLAVYYLIK